MQIFPRVPGQAKRWFVVIAVAFLSATWTLQAEPAPVQTFTDQTSVHLIEIPVEVQQEGAPVQGLSAANFAVEIDGKKVEITSFEAVDLGGREAAPNLTAQEGPRTLPVASLRRLLFLFDLSNNTPAGVARAQKSALEVLGDLAPSDLVAVGTYSRSRGFDLLLHYSPDHRQVAESLRALGKGQPTLPKDPLKIAIDLDTGLIPERLEEELDADAVPTQIQILLDKAERNRQIAEATTIYRQMEQLGELCRTIDGRKQVVFFSSGLDDAVLAGAQTNEELTKISRTANETGAIWNVDSNEYFGSNAVANSLESLIDVLRRGECVLHAIDTGGIRAEGSTQGTEKRGSSGLLALADGTGGTYLENFNGFGEAIETILDHTRHSYLLSVRAPQVKPNGKFHKIGVKLVGVQGRPRLTHRPGYFAPDAKKPLNAVQESLRLGARLFDNRPGELTLHAGAWTWTTSPTGKRRHVPMFIELAAPANFREPGPIDLFVYAFDKDLNVRDVAAQRFVYDPKAGPSGLRILMPLALEPGQFVVRVLARELTGGQVGLVVLPLTVAGEPRALIVPETFADWQISRGVRQDLKPATSHPFAFGEQFFSPALEPKVLGTSRVSLVAIGYQPEKVRVFDGSGKAVAELEAEEIHLKEVDGIRRTAFQVELPGLPPGPYQLALDDAHVALQVVDAPPLSPLLTLPTQP